MEAMDENYRNQPEIDELQAKADAILRENEKRYTEAEKRATKFLETINTLGEMATGAIVKILRIKTQDQEPIKLIDETKAERKTDLELAQQIIVEQFGKDNTEIQENQIDLKFTE